MISNGDIVRYGLTQREIVSMEQFHDLYRMSMKQRKTAFTALNAHSSRSHAIYTVHIEQTMTVHDKIRVVSGKLSIADLAGSENNKRTENRGERMTESKNINKSLLALGSVIDALNNHRRPPYRDSVLTRLLSDCLGGDSISTMICCVSGSLEDSSMTRRCLEFGSNTRKIENKVIAHVESKDSKKSKERAQKERAQKESKSFLKGSGPSGRGSSAHSTGSTSGISTGSSSGTASGTASGRRKRRHHDISGNHRKHAMSKKEGNVNGPNGPNGASNGMHKKRRTLTQRLPAKKRTSTSTTNLNQTDQPQHKLNSSSISTSSTASNTSAVNTSLTTSTMNISLASPLREPKKKRMRYSLMPTPSKLVPNDTAKAKEHGDKQRSKMMRFGPFRFYFFDRI